LVIDDDEADRMVTRLFLARAGFTVTEADNVADGIRSFSCQPVDLVFCDIFMPDKDGQETIRQLRQEFPCIKIVATCGGGFDGQIDISRTAQRLGAAAILPKPFSQADAVRVVKRVLETVPCGRLQAPLSSPPLPV
jgi:CheY-like chemotaxis protein